jgi:hypothetical protein
MNSVCAGSLSLACDACVKEAIVTRPKLGHLCVRRELVERDQAVIRRNGHVATLSPGSRQAFVPLNGREFSRY